MYKHSLDIRDIIIFYKFSKQIIIHLLPLFSPHSLFYCVLCTPFLYIHDECPQFTYVCLSFIGVYGEVIRNRHHDVRGRTNFVSKRKKKKTIWWEKKKLPINLQKFASIWTALSKKCDDDDDDDSINRQRAKIAKILDDNRNSTQK